MSLPSRGAWIEMETTGYSGQHRAVAPLAGSVDRNLNNAMATINNAKVAPLAGSVDRNFDPAAELPVEHVAPLAGSVDRNYKYDSVLTGEGKVAPLAGSVDRNFP